ncbi:nucleotidyltransferase family protein [Phormidium sp. CLA17]|uniref:nucleotidyltransferase family protein n=1 Tax=Leptolyngbya sp. Cla-17 TaxID=2803751 RepID=UPI0014924159|nr:nucleotidyltransferase family protein [Leptolyngbya sp. Cla-17]MBM0740249.1 nucleotidyltransferase family protein [Leptolyngbya sp. Cla-17]
MSLRNVLRGKRAEIFAIAAKYGASNVRVFGSVARGEEHPDSDIDFLMEIEPGRSLLDQIALMQDLERLLGRKVDVAEPETLHEKIRDRVLEEAISL